MRRVRRRAAVRRRAQENQVGVHMKAQLLLASGLAVACLAFGQASDAPKTPWGDPDLQGVYTTDDLNGVPMQRPAEFGTRRFLTEQEFAERAKQVNTERST